MSCAPKLGGDRARPGNVEWGRFDPASLAPEAWGFRTSYLVFCGTPRGPAVMFPSPGRGPGSAKHLAPTNLDD